MKKIALLTLFVIASTCVTKAQNRMYINVRYYHDEDFFWYYTMTVRGDSLMLQSFPGKNNNYHSDKNKPTDTYLGKLSVDNKITISGNRANFKLVRDTLFEMNVEGGWNKYFLFK